MGIIYSRSICPTIRISIVTNVKKFFKLLKEKPFVLKYFAVVN